MLGGCIPDAGKVEVRFSSGKPHYRFSRFVRKNGQDSIKGDYEEFYKDGKPRFLVEFAKGQIHGAIRTWSNSGQMNREIYIVNGLLHGSYKEFFENGSPKVIGNYLEGKKHGVFEFINEDGAILSKEEYINGLADGEFMHTYQDGFPEET